MPRAPGKAVPTSERLAVGLCSVGVASWGRRHAGVLSALKIDTGWDAGAADVVVGTSAGS